MTLHTKIHEANIRIAEFDGMQFFPYKDNRSVQEGFYNYKSCEEYIVKHNLIGFTPQIGWDKGVGSYHNQWMPLMRVASKIIQFKYEDGENAHFRTFGMISEEGKVMVRINRCQCFEGETLMEALWLAVSDWCNTPLITNK